MKSLFNKLGVQPLVFELDEMGVWLYLYLHLVDDSADISVITGVSLLQFFYYLFIGILR